ncbi:hypothetical protein GW17_00035469 [Ensete ventricosum]|nr:hypothetical protein GW17_00035469 [Ensete ventricosum]
MQTVAIVATSTVKIMSPRPGPVGRIPASTRSWGCRSSYRSPCCCVIFDTTFRRQRHRHKCSTDADAEWRGAGGDEIDEVLLVEVSGVTVRPDLIIIKGA